MTIKPVVQMTAIDSDAHSLMEQVSKRTGIPVTELLSNAVRQWYGLEFDVPAPHLRWEIREGKRQAEKWAA